jgi:putative flippase GtrA
MLTSPRLTRLAARVPPRLRSLARYASVSVIATIVGLSTLAVLIDVGHWAPTWANVVATAVGTVPSFELNRRWVWGRDGRRSLAREVVPYVAVCLIELVASTAAVHAMADWTAGTGWGSGVRTLADLVANVGTYGVLWVAQYFILDRVLFARRPGPDAESDRDAESDQDADIQYPSRQSSSLVQEVSSGWTR